MNLEFSLRNGRSCIAFILTDAVLALLIVSTLLLLLIVSSNRTQSAVSHLAQYRNAVFIAERVLFDLQQGRNIASVRKSIASDGNTSFTVRHLESGGTVRGRIWVIVGVTHDKKHATLMGLVRPKVLKKP